jgi:hypothetical protein
MIVRSFLLSAKVSSGLPASNKGGYWWHVPFCEYAIPLFSFCDCRRKTNFVKRSCCCLKVAVSQSVGIWRQLSIYSQRFRPLCIVYSYVQQQQQYFIGVCCCSELELELELELEPELQAGMLNGPSRMGWSGSKQVQEILTALPACKQSKALSIITFLYLHNQKYGRNRNTLTRASLHLSIGSLHFESILQPVIDQKRATGICLGIR